MAGEGGTQSAVTSFPSLAALGDPVMGHLATAPPLEEGALTVPAGIFAREPSVDGEQYLAFARDIDGYSDLPITVGAYSLKHAVDAPLRLFYWGTLVGLGMLGISLIVAALMAGAIARPIRRAARGATAIGNLDFDEVAPLSESRFREIDSLAQSFNAMLEGLRAFGRYVPRTLVTRLVKEGRVGSGSEERVLAIMFTDIVSFTSTCERMSATEVAAFINQHLSLVSACVEKEGGTIDKFIGDAVMAFWGAPGRIDNPAEAACRAAIAIQRAIATDNKRRIGEGLEPVRIRIGIHLGPVVVDDIGAPTASTTRSSATPLTLRSGWRVSAKPSIRMQKPSPWSAARFLRQCRQAFISSIGANTSSKANTKNLKSISLSAGQTPEQRAIKRIQIIIARFVDAARKKDRHFYSASFELSFMK